MTEEKRVLEARVAGPKDSKTIASLKADNESLKKKLAAAEASLKKAMELDPANNGRLLAWFGLTAESLAAVGAILMIYIGIMAKKYLVPLLAIQRNREVAEYVLIIADDVTDYFVMKYPNAHWSVWLDRAIDRIIEITGVGRDTAERVAKAAMARKATPVSKPVQAAPQPNQ